MADSDSGSGGDDDDLFADSDDTAELMASGGQPETKPAATKTINALFSPLLKWANCSGSQFSDKF